MKKLFIVPFAAAVLLAASWCRAEEIPFSVDARYEWQSSPIYTDTTGTAVALSVTNLGGSARFWDIYPQCYQDPCGYFLENYPTCPQPIGTYYTCDNAPMPEGHCMSLIARINPTGELWNIGCGGARVLQAGQSLTLGINDQRPYYGDNSGSFYGTLVVGRPCDGSISGVVSEEGTRTPISGANVTTANAATQVSYGPITTSLTGYYSIENLPPGIYDIYANFPGYTQVGQRGEGVQVSCNMGATCNVGLETVLDASISSVRAHQALRIDDETPPEGLYPFIAGKKTVVIATVNGPAGWTVMGRLKMNGALDAQRPSLVLKERYVNTDSMNWQDALYFVVMPPSGSVTFEVQLLAAESLPIGNWVDSQPYNFQYADRVGVTFVPISTSDRNADIGRCRQIKSLVQDRFLDLTPFTRDLVNFNLIEDETSFIHISYPTNDYRMQAAINEALIPFAQNDGDHLSYYVGLFPDDDIHINANTTIYGFSANICRGPLPDLCEPFCRTMTICGAGASSAFNFIPSLLAHELGHSMADLLDCPFAVFFPDCQLDYWGLRTGDELPLCASDTRGKQPKVTAPQDIMLGSGCNDWFRWDPSYKAFKQQVARSANHRTSTENRESGAYCVIHGIVGRDWTVPVFEVENLEGEYTPVEPDSGAWRLEWWDVQETELLKSLWFDPVFERREGLLDYANFFIVTSRPEDAAIVTLSIGDYEVARITQTANTPSISLLYPNGGESLADSTVIYWTASDLDGDTLRYDVFANRDGGNWEPIAIAVRDTFMTWHVSYFPGTNAGRVKVVVSDGWDNAADSSDGTFTVAAHFPVAYIESPQDTATILSTSYITLTGRGTDIEDGNIPYDSLEWYSDLSGFLGRGSLIQASNLAPGLHHISLTATDSDGNIGSDMAMVVVLADNDADGMDDAWEATHALDTTRNDAYADKDLDELSNQREYQLGTAPDSADTDGDTYSDGMEVARGSDPKNASSIPTITWIQEPAGGWGLVPDGGIGFNDPLSFSWNSCSADDSLQPLRYEVYLDADPSFSNPLIAYADTLTSITGSWQLAVGLQYSWKVKASDIYGHWIWSDTAIVMRGSNPQVPVRIEDVVAKVEGNALRLLWSPVTMDTLGNPVMVGLYIVYASPTPDQEFAAIAYSETNEWLDMEAFTLEWPNWFYQVIASTDVTPPPLVSRRAWPTNPSTCVLPKQGETPMRAQPHQIGPENIFHIRRQR